MSLVAGWVEKNFRVLHDMYLECKAMASGYDILDSSAANFQSFCVFIARLSSVNRDTGIRKQCICDLTRGTNMHTFGTYTIDYLDDEAESKLLPDEN